MNEIDYFTQPSSTAQKQYEALRAFFVDKLPATDVAELFGYTFRAFTSLVANFRKDLSEKSENRFFITKKAGRKPGKEKNAIKEMVVELRKKNHSVPDIKVIMDGKGSDVSEKDIYLILKKEGFSRLPRRTKKEKQEVAENKIKPEISAPVSFINESFATNSAGLLCFLSYVKKYGIDAAINGSEYPGTTTINKFSSIMSFLALKLSNIRRYTKDDLWCMDRGSGLFAGLNVLPKAAWFSSYSHRVTRDMNVSFLKSLHKIWKENKLLGDTSNLDFTTIPYWGDDTHLENNWSGKRHHALSSMLAVLAQDPDSGIIDYGDTDILHKNQDAVVLEYLDFYKADNQNANTLKYLVFDSKFTNYENLAKLDKNGINFITIRRRGKNIVENISKIPSNEWKKISIECSGNKKRTLKVNDCKVLLPLYGKEIRQITITGNGKIKPALIITNDFKEHIEIIIRKYARRWLVEKGISEQIEFFHLNRVSSSMVIKVDFDLTMSITAHNLYRLFAKDLERYTHLSDMSLYEKFVMNSGEIHIYNNRISVKLKKKKNLPLVLQSMKMYDDFKYDFLMNKYLTFEGMSIS